MYTYSGVARFFLTEKDLALYNIRIGFSTYHCVDYNDGLLAHEFQ